MQTQTILVVGGTGKTGRRVVAQLQARGLPVRIGSRSADPAFDWENPATWVRVLEGVGAIYLTYYPDLAVPGAVATVEAFVTLARQQGIKRLILLSGRGEDEAQRAEQVVQASGADWTIVRASWFSQNFSESYLLGSVLSGEVVLPVGNVREPFVDADDIADVVVAALTDDRHSGQLYEVTGPRALTFAEAVQEIAQATGREIRFIQISAPDFSAGMAQQGLPGGVIWLLNYLFTTVLDGRNVPLADGVQRALGRNPRDFRDYVRSTAARGVWNRPS